jgi:hypothetical protein
MTDEQKSIEDANASLMSMLEEVYNRGPEVIYLYKIRIGFWDKLVILNAGTLALSFTIVAALRGHTVGDGGIGFLFAAWKLLLIAIALSILAQWFATAAATYAHRQLTALAIAFENCPRFTRFSDEKS